LKIIIDHKHNCTNKKMITCNLNKMKLKFHQNAMVYVSLTMFNKDSILREVLILHSRCCSLITSMFCGFIQILGLQAIHIYIYIYSMDIFIVYGFKWPIYTYGIQKIIIQKHNYFHAFSKTNMRKHMLMCIFMSILHSKIKFEIT